MSNHMSDKAIRTHHKQADEGRARKAERTQNTQAERSRKWALNRDWWLQKREVQISNLAITGIVALVIILSMGIVLAYTGFFVTWFG